MLRLTRKRKIGVLIIIDSLLLIFANMATIDFFKPFIHIERDFIFASAGELSGFYLFYGSLFKVFTRINRYTNLKEIEAIFVSLSLSVSTSLLVLFFIHFPYPLRLFAVTYIFSLLLIIGSRLVWREFIEKQHVKTGSVKHVKKAIIVGAGEGGKILYNILFRSTTANDTHVVGFVDDDPDKQNTYLSGKKIIGTINDLPNLIKKHKVQIITIAIPSLPKKKLSTIFQLVKSTHVKVTTMPSIEELASGKVSISKLKNIDVVDLLERDEVELEIESIKGQLTGKVILVTGAGGSIGSEICRQILPFSPDTLLLLGHGENSIYLIDRELRLSEQKNQTKIVPIIADIQDRNKMIEIMKEFQPDIVYHAAAHKHVPLMELNPKEAVKNNIFGTKNVAEAAKKAKVKNFVMISTDKANNPPNVMGATKRIAELIVTGLNEAQGTKFSAVRFGNVLGSRGSVIPLFREQIAKGGPITVTDFHMTRYFMTIPEASRLVIQAGALAKGGEIFILDMGEPVKIVTLAKNMIRLSGYHEDEIEILETGIRPGEKLYEELLLDKERNDEAVYEKIFVGNINGYSLQKVLDFINQLPTEEKQLAREVIRFANASNQ
ncbi:nucleoside-diphosphate sugar epimerase/dehydratase [Enterococcus ratti]|uniref:polysaccharide biosynthesis protein n=1 Tax=Enterococcus ratti TaxID=150033 RepID=UPI003516CD60